MALPPPSDPANDGENKLCFRKMKFLIILSVALASTGAQGQINLNIPKGGYPIDITLKQRFKAWDLKRIYNTAWPDDYRYLITTTSLSSRYCARYNNKKKRWEGCVVSIGDGQFLYPNANVHAKQLLEDLLFEKRFQELKRLSESSLVSNDALNSKLEATFTNRLSEIERNILLQIDALQEELQLEEDDLALIIQAVRKEIQNPADISNSQE